MQATREDILKSLEDVRTKHGDEAYTKARVNLAMMLVTSPEGEKFLNEAFPDLDLGPIKEAAQRRSPEMSPPNMIAFIRSHVPSLKTEAQFNLFMAAFNALTLSIENYFSGNTEDGDKAAAVLTQALDTAKQERSVAAQVEEIPAEERSPAAASFTKPPKEFTEVEELGRLLTELTGFTQSRELSEWYLAQRPRIETLVTKQYRDELFDAIRAKQAALAN